MNLADIGKPAEVTEDNVLDFLTRAKAILDEQAVPRPYYIYLPQPGDGKARRHSRLDKRQLRRFRRAKGRNRGFHVSGYLTGNSP